MGMSVKVFSSHRFIIVLAILAVVFALISCGGSSNKKEDKSAEKTGSLTRTYKIIDEEGRESGTLTMDPAGGIVLHDANGKIVGTFTQNKSAQTPQTETQSDEEKSKEKSEEKKSNE